MKDARQATEIERLQGILSALTEDHLHKVCVYATVLAQLEKEKQPDSPAT